MDAAIMDALMIMSIVIGALSICIILAVLLKKLIEWLRRRSDEREDMREEHGLRIVETDASMLRRMEREERRKLEQPVTQKT